ncbi:hypothetical protein [Amycolatopsis sp. cg9]|uniref:effector-associated constant component EACC1 n=1 Tax=Amycolatopsis sp. cg9 TaxID=3238801 RepID=UPI003526A774
MEVRLSTIAVPLEEVGYLVRELEQEDDLRGRLTSPKHAANDDSMGAQFADVLVVALGSGGGVTALASVLAVWLKRPRGTKVELSVLRPDGTAVKIESEGVEDIEALIRATSDLALRDRSNS